MTAHMQGRHVSWDVPTLEAEIVELEQALADADGAAREEARWERCGMERMLANRRRMLASLAGTADRRPASPTSN